MTAGGEHNNQLTVCHEGGDVLVVECPSVNESSTRQPHWSVAAESLLHLELSNMRKLVIIVTLVNEYLVHYNHGSRPHLAANIERKLSEGFLDVHNELVNVRWGLLILK